ncbi:hypothetical protein VCHENC02_2159A, partial [Vibrio harveyi]
MSSNTKIFCYFFRNFD